MFTIDEIDAALSQINVDAASYEAFVINSVEQDKFTYPVFVEYVEQEFSRLGEFLGTQLINYIYSVIWCYSNTPVDEGDMILIDPEKHSSLGRELVKNNPNLIGSYLFPLILYGAEYISLACMVLPKEELDLSFLENFPDDESSELRYLHFRSSLVEAAIQARFYHLRECYLKHDMGDEEFAKKDFSDETLPVGKIVESVDE